MARFSFDTRFRPLLSATIASGLVALAMFDFAANIWDALRHPLSRGLISAAARTAYAGFFLQALILLGVYLAGSRIDRLAATIANLLAVGLFLWCSFIVGGLSSVAFNLEAPLSAEPPGSVALFFAVAVLLVAGFGVWLAARIALATVRDWRAARRGSDTPEPSPPATVEAVLTERAPVTADAATPADEEAHEKLA